jgi:hypothetical protein
MKKWNRWLATGVIALSSAAAACGGKDTTSVTPPDTTGNPVDTTTHPQPVDSSFVTVALAGNIARCTNSNDDLTAQLIDNMPATTTVIALGDNALPSGRAVDYQTCYDASWGRFKARTYAVMGTHEYDSSTTADGAVAYFGANAGPAGKGYYSFNTGTWHVIVLNTSNNPTVSYASTSEQQTWLQGDLDANAGKKCVLAVWHDPRFMSSTTVGFNERPNQTSMWTRLFGARVDVVVNGGQHQYERFAPMDASGVRNDSLGIREFISGMGGDSYTAPTAIAPNSEVLGGSYGVLELKLFSGRYEWTFKSVAGQTFTDTGSGTCH